MRIVLATETFLPHVDGIVTRLTQTIKHLRRLGDEVLILAPRRPNSPADYEGARVVTIPSMTLPQYRDVYLGVPVLPWSIQRALQRFNPDLVHVASPAFTGLGVIMWARSHKIPLVESYHVQYAAYVKHYHLEILAPFVWWYLRQVHNRADLNLATSLPMARDLRAHGITEVQHWRAGVDAGRFTPAKRSPAMRERLSGGAPGDFVIVCVARLAVEKEIDRLAPVLRALPGVRLALVGDGPDRARLQRVFAGLPVQFMGMLHGDDLVAAYAGADLFVLPSSTETLGLVALEAMAAGVPAVVANRGGLPDLVIDGQTGYLFDPDDPTDLTTRVLALMDSTPKRDAMAATARQHAERFAWAQTTRQLRGYYQQVLQGAPGQPALADDTSLSPAGSEGDRD
jgi:glycosyltransferase involved in cell wall biosynthesis